MKKYLLIGMLVPMLFGCHYTEKMDKLAEENKKLTVETRAKDAAINDFARSFDEIEQNLTTIKEKENLISVNIHPGKNPELTAAAKEQIIDDLKLIEGLMANNHGIINALQGKLSKTDSKLKELSRLIQVLNDKIAEKDKEYASLKTQLEQSDVAIKSITARADNLQSANETQSGIINAQYNELNTAYYTTGTFKELKAHKVLIKTGGIAGIGAAKKLKNDFNKDAFNKIDIDHTLVIPLKGKKADIVTTHSPDSYRLEGEEGKVERLVITDPKNFWKTSKYLVVMLDTRGEDESFDHHQEQ